MDAFPVVYTRTRYKDYSFLIQPECVRQEFMYPPIRYVLQEYYIYKKQYREIIHSDGAYCLLGCTCYIDQLIEYHDALAECTLDEGGRPVYGFFGFIVPVRKYEQIPAFDLSLCADMVAESLIPLWNERYPKKQSAPVMQLPEKTVLHPEVSTTPVTLKNCHFYPDDKGLWDMLLHAALCQGKSVSYCSFMTDYKVLASYYYTHTVTSEDILNRLQREVEEHSAEHVYPELPDMPSTESQTLWDRIMNKFKTQGGNQ